MKAADLEGNREVSVMKMQDSKDLPNDWKLVPKRGRHMSARYHSAAA